MKRELDSPGSSGLFARLFPLRADSTLKGHALACWLLGAVLLVKVGISLTCILAGHTAARDCDAIPIDTFAPAGRQVVLLLYAIIGVTNLMVCFLGGVVLFRYRALIPLMFSVMLAELLARRLLVQVIPIDRVAPPSASVVNYGLLAAMVLGLAMSLWRRPGHPRAEGVVPGTPTVGSAA